MTFNTIGTLTLLKREVWRFGKVWNQTVVAPMVTTLLFLAILTLALGHGGQQVSGLSFDRFIAPGLVMMAVVQNAFANSSSSLMLSKIQGVIIDLLMPPLSGLEVTLALTLGGVIRGLTVGLAVTFAVYLFVPFSLHSLPHALFFLIASSMMMALFGILGGIVAQSFDQMSAFTNYIITPLSFLSGTFYSIERLPEFWYHLSQYNPFFYMIDGFRYAMTGVSDGSVQTGIIVLLAMNVGLLTLVSSLFARGWRMKS